MWASVDDVRRRWMGSSWDFTDEQVQALLDDAEDAVRATVPSVDADIAANVLPAERVTRVVCRVVLRVLRNPDGKRSTNVTTGPFSQNETYAGDNPGEVYLTDEDRRDLEGSRARRRAFTVMPGGL